MRLPFVWLFLSFSAGIVAGTSLQVPNFAVWVSLFAALLSLRARSYPVALLSQLLLIALLASQLTLRDARSYETELREYVRENESQTFLLLGMVESTPEIGQDYFTIKVRVSHIAGHAFPGIARLTVSGVPRDYPVIGDQIETYARVRLPWNFRAEDVFDYERYLRKEGVHILGSVKTPALLRKLRHEQTVWSRISSLRLRLIRRIDASFSTEYAALLRALWLDDRGGLTRKIQRNMIDAGVFHVIAISGFHVALLLGISFSLMRYLLKYRSALILLAVLLFFYFILLEGRSSVTRAFLMFVLFAGAAFFHERIPLANMLSLSALLQLINNPLELFDIGFHLTYLATGFILFLIVPLCGRIHYPRAIYRWTGNSLITVVTLQLFLAPYQAWAFHRMSFAAMLAGIVAIPASSLLIVCGMLWLPFTQLHWLFRDIITFLLHLLLESSALFSEVWRPVFVAHGIRLLFCMILLFTFVVLRRRPWFRVMTAILLVGWLFANWMIPKEDHSEFFRVHFIDVGQGDSILLEYPDRTFDLVDGGGFSNPEALDIGEAVLLAYFSHAGVSNLNRVFLTHAHADHMNGLAGVMNYVATNELYVTREPLAEYGYQRFLSQCRRRPEIISAGAEFTQAGVRLRILHPEFVPLSREVTNEDSLVMLIEYAGRRLLLTGDSEASTERRICEGPDLRLDYLKVAHHGSRTSSTECFLSRTRPRFAFVSTGRNNWFGHPHPEILNRFRRFHTTVYRTDVNGTIRLAWGPSGEKIETFSGIP